MAVSACTKEKEKLPMALKCFVVHDGDEGWSIQFSTHAVKARRMGANEMNVSFDEVESCKRKKIWDKYAPGPVPILATMAEGWRWSCCHCERMICEGGPDWQEVEEANNEGYHLETIAPRPQIIEWGDLIFCGPDCAADEIKERRLRAITKLALEEWGGDEVRRLYPEAEDISARSEARGFDPWWVDVAFKFPGGQYPAHYEWHKDAAENKSWGPRNGISIARADEAAWYRYRPSPKKGGAA